MSFRRCGFANEGATWWRRPRVRTAAAQRFRRYAVHVTLSRDPSTHRDRRREARHVYRSLPLTIARFGRSSNHTESHATDLFRRSLATQQLELADAHGGRPVADTVVGGHERVLRLTVVGMIAGTELGEHNNPGEATVHVLRGRVRLTSKGQSWEARSGDLLKVPDAPRPAGAGRLGDLAYRGQATVRALST